MLTPNLSERLLILAPVGRDASLLKALATSNGLIAKAVSDVASFRDEMPGGIGAAVLTEEALQNGRGTALAGIVEEQPEWSDIPFIVIASRTDAQERSFRTVSLSKPLRNVTVLERPLRPSTALSAFESALRDRRRQYALRDVLRQYRDLSAELEQRVQERTEELRAANREMEGFTYTVSHDLRAPLRAIASTSMILKEDFGELLPFEAQDHLARQAAASTRLGILIDDLLRLSRISRTQMRRQVIDISAMVHEIVAELKERDGAEKVTFAIQPGLRTTGDPTLLRLAFTNLLENAVKFSPNGGTVEVVSDGDVIQVRDTGIGFEQEYAQKVFMPFERLVTEAEFPGTGIGLANVERIVSRHGGRVWVESESGKGSTFYLSL
jgi:signal transduction histidine kinase